MFKAKLNKILNYTSKIDLFGVPFEPYVNEDNKAFQSYIGAIGTLVIISFSSWYIITILIMWYHG